MKLLKRIHQIFNLRTAFWRAAQNTLGASGAKPTRTCVTRTVNGTGQTGRLSLGIVYLFSSQPCA